jgi:hypothetical protein
VPDAVSARRLCAISNNPLPLLATSLPEFLGAKPVSVEKTIPFPNPNPHSPRSRAAALFHEGYVVEAPALLSGDILEGESADLWNDWAVVQLSVAERAFRRALLLAPTHHDAATNLGILLFSIGNRADTTGFLRQALASTAGAAYAYVSSLLALCETQPAPATASPPR